MLGTWQRRPLAASHGTDAAADGANAGCCRAVDRRSYRGSSGNRAFDEYRDETLRRLEEEQREFKAFLDRLRHAKDKAEFDQFMAEHRRPQSGPADQPQSI
jgi:Protein of unknown function (DUF2852)